MSGTIQKWREKDKVSLTDIANSFRVSVSTVSRWESGECLMDADALQRLHEMSNGAVTADGVHQTRLDWLTANRPERMALVDRVEPATPAEAAE